MMLIVILIQCFLGFPSYWKEAAQRQLPPSARSRMPATTRHNLDDDDNLDREDADSPNDGLHQDDRRVVDILPVGPFR